MHSSTSVWQILEISKVHNSGNMKIATEWGGMDLSWWKTGLNWILGKMGWALRSRPTQAILGFCENQQPERKTTDPTEGKIESLTFSVSKNCIFYQFSRHFWSQLTPFCRLVGKEQLDLRETLVPGLLNVGIYLQETRLPCFTRCLSRFSSHSNCLSQSWSWNT